MHCKRATLRTACAGSRRGLSLPEVMVSTLLVGVLLVSAMKTVGAVFRSWQVQAELGTRESLARQLACEVAQAHYEDPDQPGGPIGLETGESSSPRAGFDDIDDFDGWTDDPVQARDGSALSGFDGWQRQVLVQWVEPGVTGAPVSSNVETGLKRVTVTVTDPEGQTTTVVRLCSKFGALEQAPSTDTTVVTWLQAELRSGSSPEAVVSSTNLVNHASDQP